MDYKSGQLMVIPTAYERQFWIKGVVEPKPDSDYIKNVVSIIGHYGSHGPHLFAAAPYLLTALKEARDALNGAPNTVGLHSQIDAAIAKAEGK